MKIWEVEFKEKNTLAKNHYEAPTIYRVHIAAKSLMEVAEKARRMGDLEGLKLIATSAQLIAETEDVRGVR